MSQLEKQVSSASDFLHKKRIIEDYLKQIMIMPRKDIISVFVCSDAVYSCTRQRYNKSDIDDYEDEDWYKKALETDNYIYSSNVPESSDAESYFSFSKRIKSINDNKKTLGVIRVDANINGINDVCNRVNVDDDGALFIVDADFNIIYSNSKLKNNISPKSLSVSIDKNNDGKIKMGGNEYMIISRDINPVGWYAVSVNSKKQMTKEAVNSLKTNGVFAIIFLIAGVIISIWGIQGYLNPLYRTIYTMQEVKKGNLNVRAEKETTYEIKTLNDSFNQMIDQIQNMFENEKDMTKKIYETELLQKEALMESLYHQIQPHFLYNTLNSISILIKCNRKEDAVKAIEELSVLMRGVTNSNKDVTVEEELNITESYIKLQQLRKEALKYSINVEEEYKSVRIPTLSIQPLVENALIHGFEDVVGKKDLSILVFGDEEFIIVEVSDDGVGIAEDILHKINEELDSPTIEKEDNSSGRRVGLINIHRRIRIKYGNDYGIRISSIEGKGTKVRLYLPRYS